MKKKEKKKKPKKTGVFISNIVIRLDFDYLLYQGCKTCADFQIFLGLKYSVIFQSPHKVIVRSKSITMKEEVSIFLQYVQHAQF